MFAPLLLCLAASALSVQDQPDAALAVGGTRHALVIGNGDYEGRDPVPTAVGDAQALAALLEEDYGFEVQLLTDATREGMESAMWEYAETLEAKDDLLLYFAGHGEEQERTRQGYWLGVDAGRTPVRWLGNRTIRDILEVTEAGRILVISDAHFSEKLTAPLGDAERSADTGRARLLLSSGQALPGASTTSLSGDQEHSPFSGALLEVLRSGEGKLGTDDLLGGMREALERAGNPGAAAALSLALVRDCGHMSGDFALVRELPEDIAEEIAGQVAGAEPPVEALPLEPVGPEGPAALITGRVEQPGRQAVSIRIAGTPVEERVFGAGAYLLPLLEGGDSIELIATVNGVERDRRRVTLGEASRRQSWNGSEVPVHDLATWTIPSLPVYVEGFVVLPEGATAADMTVLPDPRELEGFNKELHLGALGGVTGAFQLVLPATTEELELLVFGSGLDEQAIPLALDGARETYRGGRLVPLVDLGPLELRPATAESVPISLDLLDDREAYAQLEEEDVRALAMAAEIHWEDQFAWFDFARVERYSCGDLAHWMAIWTHRTSGLEFVLVPGGTLRMGSSMEDRRRWPDENAMGWFDDEKQHSVPLAPFLIARTECTQEAWKLVAEEAEMLVDPSRFPGDTMPVDSVSWNDVVYWCDQTGLNLPTEAQWEYACRAGSRAPFTFTGENSEFARFGNVASAETSFDWGEKWSDGYGNETAPVGSFEPNAFGLHDVHGNVWEWCRDWYVDYYNDTDKHTGQRSGISRNRVTRGGGFDDGVWLARCSERGRLEPGGSFWNLGFRPAVDLP